MGLQNVSTDRHCIGVYVGAFLIVHAARIKRVWLNDPWLNENDKKSKGCVVLPVVEWKSRRRNNWTTTF
jgi:hypothetical protein